MYLSKFEMAFTEFSSSKLYKNSVKLSVIEQHYAIITPLFDTQAPTCFGINVPSSGSFLFPRELLESRNGYVVCHIL
jgi:hypothetical protein